MNKPEDPMAALTSEGVRILAPDYALKDIIGNDIDIRQAFSAEAVEKAQSVINEHRDSFIEWIAKDIEQLETHYAAAMADLKASPPEIQKLARAAFVIKSQAGTFGFGLATQVAKSLDDFCNKHFHPTPEHMTVIRKHIDVISTIFSKNITGDGGAVGKELGENLFRLVAKFKDT